jgi:hypothetical protein
MCWSTFFHRCRCCCYCCCRNTGEESEIVAIETILPPLADSVQQSSNFTYTMMNQKTKMVGCYFNIIEKDLKLLRTLTEMDVENNPNSCFLVGWKFHLNIYWEDIARTWDIVKDIVIHYNIIQTKTLRQNTLRALQERSDGEQGREITIYAFKEPDNQPWIYIIQLIEQGLASAGIRSVQRSPACRLLPNCQFVSYRCDRKGGISDEVCKNPNQAFKEAYIEYDEAIELAREHRDETHNPYGLAIPPFLSQLIQQLQQTNAAPIANTMKNYFPRT